MSWHNMATAINASLTQCLADDTQVVLLGQDIGKTGGVFRITQGLQNQFSEQRVIDTPISETLLGGMAIGMAIAGYRPIVEFQFMGFMYSALDHIISHASRIRNRTRGKLSCPLVYRTPFGPGVNAPEHHSESTEAMLCHTPGIRVVVPSTPFNAYHLLKQAVVSDDPVVFLEPTSVVFLASFSFSVSAIVATSSFFFLIISLTVFATAFRDGLGSTRSFSPFLTLSILP